MAANINFRSLSCATLAEILKSRGISHSKKKKEELIGLCEQAEALQLPIIDDRSGDDSEEASRVRRTVKGKTYPHPLDPVLKELEWSGNLSGMPSLDAFDITTYLLNYCGWSQERIQRRKSDNGYQLHVSGHIHDVNMAKLDSNLVYIKARCIPETKQSNNPYSPWILIQQSGHIISAECTCVAGDGSCKHVIALLFGLADQVLAMEDRATIGVTDTSAYWNKPRKVSRPVTANDLDTRKDVSQPKKAKATEESGYFPLNPDHLDVNQVEKDICKLLKNNKVPSVCLYTLSDSEDSDDDISMSVESYPPNIIDLIKKNGKDNLKVADTYIDEVSKMSQGQSSNSMWKYQRMGRLTASNFYNASHYSGDNEDNYIVKRVLGEVEFNSDATTYGITQEPIAMNKYYNHMCKNHTSFQYSLTGLVVFKDYPFLAASPDGVVKCKCCSKGLVEIKCPYTLRKESSQAAMSNSPSCILKNGKYELKKSLSSPFYVQMLGQMAICNAPYCDFVLCTQKDMYIERIQFDIENWNILLDKLQNFYKKFVLPKF